MASGSGDSRTLASVDQTLVILVAGATYYFYSGFWNPWLVRPLEAEDGDPLKLHTVYQSSLNYRFPFGPETAFRKPCPNSLTPA